MGWWETEDGLALGDGPLDELHRSLRQVTSSYANALERPPRIAELQQLLALVLDSLGPNDVTGLEELSVTAVAVKTKKGPKKQKYAVGDVFAVPVDDGTFGFGRILWADTQRSEIVIEFFRHRAAAPLVGPDVVDTGRLGNVAKIWAGYSVEKTRWPILHHTPGYRAPDHDDIRFQFWSGGDKYNLSTIEGQVLARDVGRAQVPEDLPYTDDYTRGATDWPEAVEQDLAGRLEKAGL